MADRFDEMAGCLRGPVGKRNVGADRKAVATALRELAAAEVEAVARAQDIALRGVHALYEGLLAMNVPDDIIRTAMKGYAEHRRLAAIAALDDARRKETK